MLMNLPAKHIYLNFNNPQITIWPCSVSQIPTHTGYYTSFLLLPSQLIVYLLLLLFSRICCCCSIAQSCPTLCSPMDYRLACPSPSPGVCSNSCPLSQWCHPTTVVVPSRPLSSPSPPAFSLSQNQSLFQ